MRARATGRPTPRRRHFLANVCREHGISEATLDRWKFYYGDEAAEELHRLRMLENENHRLRELVVNQTLDIDQLKSSLRKDSS